MRWAWHDQLVGRLVAQLENLWSDHLLRQFGGFMQLAVTNQPVSHQFVSVARRLPLGQGCSVDTSLWCYCVFLKYYWNAWGNLRQSFCMFHCRIELDGNICFNGRISREWAVMFWSIRMWSSHIRPVWTISLQPVRVVICLRKILIWKTVGGIGLSNLFLVSLPVACVFVCFNWSCNGHADIINRNVTPSGYNLADPARSPSRDW